MLPFFALIAIFSAYDFNRIVWSFSGGRLHRAGCDSLLLAAVLILTNLPFFLQVFYSPCTTIFP